MDHHATALGALKDIETWVFDLDNTLYDASTNVFDFIDLRMRSFIADFLDLDLDEAYRLQKRYFKEYGTTLRGLIDHHAVDPDKFLEYVHDIDLSNIEPSPAMDAALTSLRGRKIIFTNASDEHARRIIERLGVGHHFEAVFDIASANYVPKPDPRIYAQLLGDHRIDPANSVFIDDIARNLKPAADLGMTTVWVRSDSEWSRQGSDGGHIHHITDNLVPWLEEVVGGG